MYLSGKTFTNSPVTEQMFKVLDHVMHTLCFLSTYNKDIFKISLREWKTGNTGSREPFSNKLEGVVIKEYTG